MVCFKKGNSGGDMSHGIPNSDIMNPKHNSSQHSLFSFLTFLKCEGLLSHPILFEGLGQISSHAFAKYYDLQPVPVLRMTEKAADMIFFCFLCMSLLGIFVVSNICKVQQLVGSE